MKFSAVRNPNERWLIDLILLFMPSTAPLETRCLVHDRTPSRCPRSMRTNFLKGSQPGTHGRTHPFLQVIAGPLGLPVIPEQLKSFFEVVGTHDRRVPPHQRRKALFLVVAEIPRILQQQPAAALEGHLLFLTQPTHFTPPDFLDRFVEVLDDVEPVEQDLRLGRVLFHQIGVGRPHVHADHAQGMAAPCAHFFGEERSDCLLGPVVTHPQQVPPLQVVDYGQVDLPLPPAHRINANDVHRRTRAVLQPYCTARFTIVATLFKSKPYWRAVPCQLNSRASRATPLDKAVVTRAHGSAQGKSSTRTPHRGHSTRRGRYRSFSGNFRIDRSRQTRAFCTLCTFRHRCRQSPQRRSRLPRRSMSTTMNSSVSSTFVTV